MKKVLAFVCFALSAGFASAQTPFSRGADGAWSVLSGWRANYGSGWVAATNFPGAADSVTLNNGRILNVDVSSTVDIMQLVNNSLDAVLNVNSANTLTIATLTLGHATQAGNATVNQSAGTIYSTTSTIGSLGSGTYNLTGGEFSVDGTTTINGTGLLDVDGGVLTFDTAGDNDLTVEGNGLLKLQSGTVTATGSDAGDLLIVRPDVEISGGTMNLVGQNYFTGEFRVIGNGATLSITRLNNNASNNGSFVFEMGPDGISPISNPSWMNLDSATITVDGSSYAGGSGTFTLFSAVNLATTASVTSVTGFAEGVTAVITQDQDNDVVTLTVTVPNSSNLATVASLGNLTNAPALRADDTSMALTNVSPGEMKAVYFDALDYMGSPTRVYAWIGIPAGASSNSPVPGVVLVHGGGGTAFSEWVSLWTNRGYAAISIAVEGQTDSTNAPVMNTGWHIHNMPGPVRDGIYGDSDVEPITDQWMYHAVADTVLANSLLRSLPEVAATNVGLMGVSWGGVITSTAIGIDDRFRFAVPTYGCGNKDIAENIYGDALGDNDLYKEVWDPMVRIANATPPVLWFSWPQEWHFPLYCQRDTYAAAPGTHMVSLVPYMQHGHAAAWNRPESYAFADSIISNGTPWCVQQSAVLTNGAVDVEFSSTKNLDAASLISTIDWGLTGDRTWTEIPAVLVTNGGGSYTVTADLPSEFTTAWFVNVSSGSLISSSDFQENPDVLPPSNVVYNVSTNWSSKTVKANDAVTITNGATVELDQDAAAATLTVNAGTLQMDQNYTMNVSGALAVDAYGSIALNNGTLLPAGVITLDGDITLNGGSFYRGIAGTGFTVSGDGVWDVRSGILAFTNGAATDVLELNTDIEISGGMVDFDGQVYIGHNTPTECTIIGDDAVIQIERLNQGAGGNSGTFRFVLDETGVSTMNVSAWMNLANLVIEVDGSGYAGGATNILLLDAVNLSALGDTNNFSVSGFTQNGLIASVVQDQTDGKDWVQLVLQAHTSTTVTVAASADWSSFPIFGNDDVVINSGVTVTVDAEAFADSLQLDGTLLLPLGMTGFTPITLNDITVGTGGSIIVDGSDYEGFDGYFPLIYSTNLTEGLTNDVLFVGFGAREPVAVVQNDGLWLRLISPPSLSERLCSLVPDSTVAPAWSNSSFSATRTYDPSGSDWTPTFSEAHVMDTRLSHLNGEGDAWSWDLRLARGGNIYSLRTPLLGETVPPSYRSDTNSSPWNDEVWQGVAVDSSQNDVAAGDPYFTHQSGVYLRDSTLTEPFYSPQVASFLDEDSRSYTTINWIPQTHINIYADNNPDNDFKSYLLMFTRYRDLGQGVIEVSLGYYNYGPDTLDFLNMPWGGVRRTAVEHAFLSEPGGTTWSEPLTNDWGETIHFDQTGGWAGYCATSSGVTPALGFIFGEDHVTPLPAQRYDYSTFRWGYSGGKDSYQTGEADWRNYFVTSIVRWYNLTQGTGVWSRYYFALGEDLQDLSDRVAARGLVDAQLAAFSYAETNSPLIAYSVSGSGTGFQCMEGSEGGGSVSFFLYAHPVSGTFPVFEVLESDGTRYLTWNPYANGIVKPYDGRLAGLRLLGFAPTASAPGYTYEMLSGRLPAENYKADGKTLYVRTATSIETWRVEYFERTDNEGDAANLADPDGDGWNNLAEYAFGGFPTLGSNETVEVYHFPRVGNIPAGDFQGLEILYNRRINSGLTYTLEATSNLTAAAWSTAGVEEIGAGAIDSEFETVTNTVSVGNAGFARLIVEAGE